MTVVSDLENGIIYPKIELLVIRHGESAWNAGNVGGPHIIGGRSNETPLTDLGQSQSKNIGRLLLKKGLIPDRVFSSPAVRALDTCRIALSEMGLDIDVTVDYALQEMDQGDWVGHTRDEVYTPEVRSEMERLGMDFKSPGGESMHETGIRIFNWANSTFEDTTEPQLVYVFGHGMATRSFAAYLHNWTREQTFLAETDNTSLSLFNRLNGRWTLDYLGRKIEDDDK